MPCLSNNDRGSFLSPFPHLQWVFALPWECRVSSPPPVAWGIYSLGKHLIGVLWLSHSNCPAFLQACTSEEDSFWSLTLTTIILMSTQWRSVEKSLWAKCEFPVYLWLPEVLYCHISSKSDFWNLLEVLAEFFLLIHMATGVSSSCALLKVSQSSRSMFLERPLISGYLLPYGLSYLMGSKKIMILYFICSFSYF